ncbi:MAG: phosphate acetyltransferase [Clostridia bacterium]
MEFDGVLKKIIENAKEYKKTIVLPEATDIRILEAASIIQKENIANVILIGKEDNINKLMKEKNINSSNVKIIDPIKYEKFNEYVEKFYQLRKHKGITLEDARQIMQDNVYFSTMMVNELDADGMVSGAAHSTSDTLRPALQIIKQATGINNVSSFFLMEVSDKKLGKDGVFIFSDCGLIALPTEEELVDIALSSANTFKMLLKQEPKVALLSYSTKGSAKGDSINKIVNVCEKLKKLNLDFEIDGELQLDAAIIPEVASMKAPNSKVAGQANVLIFPNLEAGNIAYKIAQRFGNALAIGPITQGLRRPVNDLSRGCNVKDIIGAVAITCVQAKNN